MRRIQLSLVCAVACLAATAAPITPQQARQAAVQFITRHAMAGNQARAVAATQAQPCAVNSGEQTVAYAVNMAGNQGFVLVDASGEADAIIGYCDHGTFDPQHMPANMRSWLNSYMACASMNGDHGQARQRRASSRHATKTRIAPLLQSQWNQTAPYNGLTPIVGGKRCATGCTITGFAQVMYYHRWPTAATAAIPGYSPDNASGTNYPALPALEATTFDWDKMYPTYDNGEDGSEVARLMQYLGTASRADYGSETNATGYHAIQAMIKYFGYDAAAQTVWRRQLGYDEWIDRLYAELQAGRPVMFSGTAPDAGHSFVVDGYDEEDYFHVNWGWGGDSDGFYRVVLMDPKDQGTGGSVDDDAYTIDQVAFFGVQPNQNNAAAPARLTVKKNWLLCNPDGGDDYNTVGSMSTSPFFKDMGYLVYPFMNSHNYTSIYGEFSLGSRLVKDDGSVTRDYAWASANFDPNTGFENHSDCLYLNPVTDPELTDGDYKMYFTSKLKTESQWQQDEDSENHYVKIHLDHAQGLMTATSVCNEYNLTLKDIKFLTTDIMVNKPCDVKLTLQNIGTKVFHGEVGLTTKVQETDKWQWLDAISCDIGIDETIDVSLSFTPKKAGELNYIVEDYLDKSLYSGSLVVKEDNTTSNCDLTITHKVTNAEGTEIVGPRAKLDLTVTNNNDMDYNGEICVYCFKWTGDTYNFVYAGKEETIPAHTTVTLHRESPSLTDAERYSFTTMYMKGEQQVQQDGPDVYYTVVPYCTAFDANGEELTMRLTPNLQPDASICTVVLTDDSVVKSINTTANPNMIILANEGSNLTGNNIVKGKQADNISLTDGYPYYCPLAFNASHISYTRTPDVYYNAEANTGWTTLVLPFAPTGCQTSINGTTTPLQWQTSNNDGELRLVTFEYENGTNMEYEKPGSALMANHPYLMGIPAVTNSGKALADRTITFYADNVEVEGAKASVTGRNYKMMGTLAPIKDKADIYVLNADGSAFVPGTSVSPFRAYFVPIGNAETASQLTISVPTDATTGINDIIDRHATDGQGTYYNLNGQRVSNPSKGIYIQGGKKVIVK